MRAFLKFLINVALIAGVIWLIVRFTTIDDKIIEFFTKKTVVTTSAPCTTPRGVKIPDNSSIFAYATPEAGNGECAEQLRTCKNGTLQGEYTYPSCTAGNQTGYTEPDGNNTGNGISPTGASCTTPWGQTIAHGNYIVAYVSPSSCTFQRRMCVDGQLLGKFMYNYCILPYPMAAGTEEQGGNSSPYGVDATVYQGNNPLNGMPTDQQPTTSINDGSPYTSESRHYTPVNYGGNIANTQLPDDYWNQNARGTTSFVKSRNDTKTNPLATQGQSTNYNGVKDWNYNNYDLTQKGCKTPWGTFVDNGQYVIAYKTATAAKGGSCEYERRTCFNGQLNGSFGQPSCSMQGKVSTPSTRQYGNQGYDNYYRTPTPAPRSNASCYTPRGTRIANGNYIRAYKYSSAPWSNGCEGEIRYCHNGLLDGSYSNKTCNLKTPVYPRCYGRLCGDNDSWRGSCNLPRGGSIINGNSVIAYNGSYGSCYSERRTCTNGRLQGSYTSQNCRDYDYHNYNYNNNYYYNDNHYDNHNDNNNRSCQLPRGGWIGNGQAVEAFATSSSPCLKESRQCYNGQLQGSYTVQYCNLTPPPPSYPSVDSYSDWQDAGRMDSIPNGSDSCHGDAIATFTCQAQDETTCTDYRKVASECCGGTKGRYESRTVTCVR